MQHGLHQKKTTEYVDRYVRLHSETGYEANFTMTFEPDHIIVVQFKNLQCD